MRVALVTSLVSPIRPAAANGPHAVVIDLARGLVQRGHRPTIDAAAGSVVDGLDLVEVPVAEGAAAASFRAGHAPTQAAVAALERGFERLFERIADDAPDVVSQHAFDAAAFVLGDRIGPPVLHTLHLPPVSEDVIGAARRSRGALASVSRHAQRVWEEATGRSVALLRNGVRELELASGPMEPIALIAGRIAPEKGTHVAIRVARRAGLGVLVAGDAYDPEYQSTVVGPLLADGEWIGPVPREKLFGLMARCAVLLMLIDWDEPFGLVAAEAQMAGCPVVGYRRGALPEVVGDGIGGYLVEPEDEEALVGAVARARELDRDAIRAHARRSLGVARMIDDYERALMRLAS